MLQGAQRAGGGVREGRSGKSHPESSECHSP